MRIGLREANQRFSKAVKGGAEVLLTERGKPVAVLKPIPGSERAETVIRRLETAGLLRPPSKALPLPPWKPRSIKGAPLSHTIREERSAGQRI
jgi:prevent-host-death family protein